MGGLGLMELLLLLLIAGALAAVTIGSRRVRGYGRNLGRGHGWDFHAEVLDELGDLRDRLDVLAERVTDVAERLDAAEAPELPPGPDPAE